MVGEEGALLVRARARARVRARVRASNLAFEGVVRLG